MDYTSPAERIVRGVLIALVLIFFLFPIVWIFLMSFQKQPKLMNHLSTRLCGQRCI